MTRLPVPPVHVTYPASSVPRCETDSGTVITWEEATDPANPLIFTCGACLRAVAGGREPMGGSLR